METTLILYLSAEAGSGKSEISINFAKWLVQLQDKPVHFFDMDMTKPLFRSRDVEVQMEEMGIICHHEKQFMDGADRCRRCQSSVKG